MAYVGETHLRSMVRTRPCTIAGSGGVKEGYFAQIMMVLAAGHGEEKTVMIDATYLKTHRTATSMGVKRGRGRLTGRTKGGMNTKLHAVCDSQGRPISFFVAAGQVSDYIGARAP